jgi:protein TonB
VRAQIRDADPAHNGVMPLIDPPALRIAAKAEQMGGGGGQRGETPVSKGHLPKLEQEQIVPPTAPPLLPPKIAM